MEKMIVSYTKSLSDNLNEKDAITLTSRLKEYYNSVSGKNAVKFDEIDQKDQATLASLFTQAINLYHLDK